MFVGTEQKEAKATFPLPSGHFFMELKKTSGGLVFPSYFKELNCWNSCVFFPFDSWNMTFSLQRKYSASKSLGQFTLVVVNVNAPSCWLNSAGMLQDATATRRKNWNTRLFAVGRRLYCRYTACVDSKIGTCCAIHLLYKHKHHGTLSRLKTILVLSSAPTVY